MRAEDRALVPPRAASCLSDAFPALVIVACTCFNFLLCFINTNVFPVSNTLIILCEIILISTSTIYGFLRIDHARLYWLTVMLLQIGLLMLLSLVKHDFLDKPVRDVIIMPVFIALGLSAGKADFSKPMIWLGVFILFVALLEAIFPHQFLHLINFRKYYVAKGSIRDLDYFGGLDVNINGQRPEGGFISRIPGLHRISSIFLEPVSLGFFAFISGLFFIATKEEQPKKRYYAGLFISFLLILLSDARMALGSLVLILLCRPVFARLDHRLSALVFPAVLALGVLIYTTGILGATGEGIGGRMNWTMGVLSRTNTDILLGASQYMKGDDAASVEDSALAKLLTYQGLFGFLLYWLSPIFFLRRMSRQGTIYMFGIAIFLSFGFMLSAAIFSIKTAALLWFSYGYLINRYQQGMEKDEIPEKVLADLS
jgi:putative polymerase